MESKVISDLTVPVFHPTMDEFAEFKNYISKLEQQNLSFAKVSFIISEFYKFRDMCCVTVLCSLKKECF